MSHSIFVAITLTHLTFISDDYQINEDSLPNTLTNLTLIYYNKPINQNILPQSLYSVTLRHNTAAYRSGVNVMIDGGLIRTTLANPDTGNLIMYSGNTLPAHSPITAIESNIIGLNIIKKAANSYIVYMSNSIFGLT